MTVVFGLTIKKRLLISFYPTMYKDLNPRILNSEGYRILAFHGKSQMMTIVNLLSHQLWKKLKMPSLASTLTKPQDLTGLEPGFLNGIGALFTMS